MGHLISGGYLGHGVLSKRGPYWQPDLAVRRFSSALGDATATNLVLPVQAMAGASGYIAAVVTAPPVAQIQWNSSQTPQVQVWVKDTTGAIKLFSGGGSAAGTASVNWVTAGSTGVTFYVIPVDAAGNTYAPVDAVMVPGTPGIYPSLNTPSSVTAQLSASNQGLQVYGLESTPPPAPTSSDPFAFLASLPGGETPWLIGGALVLFMALGGHK